MNYIIQSLDVEKMKYQEFNDFFLESHKGKRIYTYYVKFREKGRLIYEDKFFCSDEVLEIVKDNYIDLEGCMLEDHPEDNTMILNFKMKTKTFDDYIAEGYSIKEINDYYKGNEHEYHISELY